MNRRVDRYNAVLVGLEDAFNQFETGRISINGYLDAVDAIDQAFRRQRPYWLWLCDWTIALRGLNRAERRAFTAAIDSIDWCRNWAIRQRGVDVRRCLENAEAQFDFGFAHPMELAA